MTRADNARAEFLMTLQYQESAWGEDLAAVSVPSGISADRFIEEFLIAEKHASEEDFCCPQDRTDASLRSACRKLGAEFRYLPAPRTIPVRG